MMAVRILRGDPDGGTAEWVSGTGTGVRPVVVALTAGAVALAVAPLLPMVTAADQAPVDTASPVPGFPSWPLLVVLAALPAAVAMALAYRGAGSVAAGVVLGVAALAPGRALLDVQLIADAGLAARPELLVPTSLAPLQAGPAVILLLAGHLLTAVAGVWVLLATRSPERADDPVPADGSQLELILEGRTGSRQGAFVAVLGLGAAAAAGVLVAPFGSDNAYLLGRSAFDAPGWTLAGSVLLALLVPAAACLLISSAEQARARGGLIGLALGLAAVAAPPLAAALVMARLQPSWGPVVTLLAAAGLIISAALLRARPDTQQPARELTLPVPLRLHRLAAVAALLAGALTLAAAALPAIVVSPPTPAPAVSAARVLVPAAVVLLGLGAALLLLAARAGVARPALAVSWVVVPLASGAVLETVLTAGEIADVGLGAGAWAAVVAIPVAAVAGLIAALGGAVERDDVDLTELTSRGTDRPVLLTGLLAAALAVPAFGLPVASGPGYRAAAVAPGSGLAAWGLATAMVALMLAALLAARCRPVRAAALLAGAGLVVMVRLAELPLVAGRIDEASAAAGTWLSLACLVVLALGMTLAVRPAVSQH